MNLNLDVHRRLASVNTLREPNRSHEREAESWDVALGDSQQPPPFKKNRCVGTFTKPSDSESCRVGVSAAHEVIYESYCRN